MSHPILFTATVVALQRQHLDDVLSAQKTELKLNPK